MNHKVEPLARSKRWKEPTALDNFLMGMPVIGLQASERKSIIAQLKRRDASCITFWSKDKQRLEIFESISKIIQEYFRHSNRYFIPDDPFEILLWEPPGLPGSNLAIEDALMDLEDKFGISLSEQDCIKMLNMTLGEVVDLIIGKLSIKLQINSKG